MPPGRNPKNKKSPVYPLHLGGVWMVGVRGYTGQKTLITLPDRAYEN
jgi:hypothetical protein